MSQPKAFILDLGLFEPQCGSIDWSELILLDLLRILCFANRRALDCGNIPPLYQSGVRYKTDAASPYWKKLALNGSDVDKEIFMAIPAILRDGGADCEDLSAWRVAELRNQGEGTYPVQVDAREQFYVRKFQVPDGSLVYHVQVQRLVWDGRGWQKGAIEDPSRLLGMGGPEDQASRKKNTSAIGRLLSGMMQKPGHPR